MVGIQDLPLKVQGLHGAVHLAHDVVRLALGADAEVPLGALDGRAPVGLLHLVGGGLVTERRHALGMRLDRRATPLSQAHWRAQA